MPRASLIFIFVLALTATVRGTETAHGHHEAMNAASAVSAELGAQAAFDNDGVLWAAHKVGGFIAVSRSADRGQSWSSPVLVTSAPESTDAGGDARPKIVLGPAREIYVSWTRPLGKPFTGEIRFSRSVDGGRTFTTPVVVHHDRQEITHRFDALAVNARGQVFVAWIDKRDVVAATAAGQPYRGAAVYFAVSDDRGATFRGDFKVADHSCECCRIALVSTGDGVTALWRQIFEPNVRDHATARLSANGTASAVERATFEDWRLDACPHHGPAVAADAHGQLQAVWFSMAPQHEGIFYGRLGGPGVAAVRRIGGETAEHADIAIAGERAALAWKEFDGQRSLLRGAVSNDGGRTWREVELGAAAGPSDHPRVLARDGRFFAFWNTTAHPLSVMTFP